jgi:hypothetical protein
MQALGDRQRAGAAGEWGGSNAGAEGPAESGSCGGGGQVNKPEGKLVLSERAAMTSQLAKQLKPGDIVDGIVTRLRDFGAFVSLRSPDGCMHGVEVPPPLPLLSSDFSSFLFLFAFSLSSILFFLLLRFISVFPFSVVLLMFSLLLFVSGFACPLDYFCFSSSYLFLLFLLFICGFPSPSFYFVSIPLFFISVFPPLCFLIRFSFFLFLFSFVLTERGWASLTAHSWEADVYSQ